MNKSIGNTKNNSFLHRVGHFLDEAIVWISMIVFTGIIVFFVVKHIVPLVVHL